MEPPFFQTALSRDYSPRTSLFFRLGIETLPLTRLMGINTPHLQQLPMGYLMSASGR